MKVQCECREAGREGGSSKGTEGGRAEVMERTYNVLWKDCFVKTDRLLYSASHSLQVSSKAVYTRHYLVTCFAWPIQPC